MAEIQAKDPRLTERQINNAGNKLGATGDLVSEMDIALGKASEVIEQLADVATHGAGTEYPQLSVYGERSKQDGPSTQELAVKIMTKLVHDYPVAARAAIEDLQTEDKANAPRGTGVFQQHDDRPYTNQASIELIQADLKAAGVTPSNTTSTVAPGVKSATPAQGKPR